MKKLLLAGALLMFIVTASSCTPQVPPNASLLPASTQPQQETVQQLPLPKLVETFVQQPAPDQWSNGFPAKGVPILYYHSIEDRPGNELGVPPKKFTEQMKYLSDNGYTSITLEQLYQAYRGGKLPPKPVAITLDDGYPDNYTAAFPVLKQYKFTATIFAFTGGIGHGMLTWDQVKEMNAYGIAIMPHTVNHVDLSKLSRDAQRQEIENSKLDLEQNLGIKANFFCYPYGHYNNDTIKLVKELGFTAAFTTATGKVKPGDDLYHLKRVYVNGLLGMDTFKTKLNS